MFAMTVRQRADILQMIAGFAVIDLIEPLLLVFRTGAQANGCFEGVGAGRLVRLRFTPCVSGVYEREADRI